MESSNRKMSWIEVRDLFREWREENVRKSQTVVELWDTVLREKLHKLGDEQYIVLEQVCLAAADVSRYDVVDYCVIALKKKFPGSARVHKLIILRLELMERYDEALEKLEQLSTSDDTNAAYRKRKVAILKAKGQTGEAIKALIEYLKKFMSDQEAWQELSELYLAEQEYAKAAFCMEEVILNSPHNHLYHQRFADIKYTQGGYDNLEIARSHYCLAIKLSPNNMRALYGLFLCASNIAVNQKSPSQKKKESSKLASWAMQQIQDRYSELEPAQTCIASLEGLMNNLQLTSA